MEKYTAEWEKALSLPEQDGSRSNWRRHIYLFSFSGFLYCIVCAFGESAVYSVHRYDHDWFFVTFLPQQVYKFSALAVGSNLLIVGGCNPSNELVSSAFAFDLKTPNWECLKDIPFACASPHLVELGSFVHVLTNHSKHRKVASLDLSKGASMGTWSCDVIPNVQYPLFGAVVMNECLVVICSSHSYVYVPEHHVFLVVSSSPASQDPLCCLSDGSNLFAFPSSLQSSGTGTFSYLSVIPPSA